MKQPATATVKGERKMDDHMENLRERFSCFGICRERLLLAALDWRGGAEFQRSK
jgi:hypothetical protein